MIEPPPFSQHRWGLNCFQNGTVQVPRRLRWYKGAGACGGQGGRQSLTGGAAVRKRQERGGCVANLEVRGSEHTREKLEEKQKPKHNKEIEGLKGLLPSRPNSKQPRQPDARQTANSGS